MTLDKYFLWLSMAERLLVSRLHCQSWTWKSSCGIVSSIEVLAINIIHYTLRFIVPLHLIVFIYFFTFLITDISLIALHLEAINDINYIFKHLRLIGTFMFRMLICHPTYKHLANQFLQSLTYP
jgi:hypothetical protein